KAAPAREPDRCDDAIAAEQKTHEGASDPERRIHHADRGDQRRGCGQAVQQTTLLHHLGMRRGASSAPWLAAFAGVALAASFPPLGFAPLAWVALWPLLVAVRTRAAVGRLVLGTITGLVWAGCTVAPWLYPAIRSHLAAGTLTATLLTTGAVWTYGGVYLALFALVYSWLPRPRWLAAPAAWVLLETLRTRLLGGAPWALLGHSQHALLALAQIAELGGVGSLSFLVLMPAAALAAAGRERIVGLAAALVATLAAATFGTSRLAAPTPAEAGHALAA